MLSWKFVNMVDFSCCCYITRGRMTDLFSRTKEDRQEPEGLKFMTMLYWNISYPWKVVSWNLFKFSSVSSMDDEHFQAPFRVITLGSIQVENNQIEKPPNLGVNCLAAWLHVIRLLKYRLQMIIQTERLRASSCKHCKPAVLVRKNIAAFLACHLGSLREKYYYLAC